MAAIKAVAKGIKMISIGVFFLNIKLTKSKVKMTTKKMVRGSPIFKPKEYVQTNSSLIVK